MINTAIVDDQQESTARLRELLERFQEEHRTPMRITEYSSGVALLNSNMANLDLVFMDIEMPHMNGMEAARALRRENACCQLIFVTNMAQYAIEGYEVNAIDYMLKPITYQTLEFKLPRAIQQLESRKRHEIVIKTANEWIKLDVSDIYYVEVVKHELIYHTAQGEYRIRGALNAVEAELEGRGFARCNVCYLVNLNHVSSIQGNFAVVGEDKLKISSPKKSDFIMALMGHMKGMK